MKSKVTILVALMGAICLVVFVDFLFATPKHVHSSQWTNRFVLNSVNSRLQVVRLHFLIAGPNTNHSVATIASNLVLEAPESDYIWQWPAGGQTNKIAVRVNARMEDWLSESNPVAYFPLICRSTNASGYPTILISGKHVLSESEPFDSWLTFSNRLVFEKVGNATKPLK